VLDFAYDMESTVLALHQTLLSQIYQHGSYKSFYICDPKRRHIHKATVVDRLLHHAVFRVLYEVIDKSFIYDSYSSRKEKGIHKAVERFESFALSLSQNNTRTIWILKCDIKKFFDSVDQDILMDFIKTKIRCTKTLPLLEKIIKSFSKGIPLGNITSQLFSNIYLDKLDQCIKRVLRVKYYIRYADDFLILNTDRVYLEVLVVELGKFTRSNLNLEIHPQKILIQKWHNGIDFLGYISFPHHKILRTKTKKRIFNRLSSKNISSYLGVLSHTRSFRLSNKLKGLCYNKSKR
jgi:RNA-directed DNA polymerase